MILDPQHAGVYMMQPAPVSGAHLLHQALQLAEGRWHAHRPGRRVQAATGGGGRQVSDITRVPGGGYAVVLITAVARVLSAGAWGRAC
ncbi:MAG: hypothetical protein ABW278_08265 [Steroidobacteraceae bacterium]